MGRLGGRFAHSRNEGASLERGPYETGREAHTEGAQDSHHRSARRGRDSAAAADGRTPE